MLWLSKVLCGFVVSLALALAGRIEEGYLPVHLVNTESLARPGKTVDGDLVPVLLSHFLGDGSAEVLADQEAVVTGLASRFMDSTNAVVLVVENLALDRAERALGSADFYFAAESAKELGSRARLVSTQALPSALEWDNFVLWLDAAEHGQDHVDFVLESLRETSAKVMLVALPSAVSADADSFALRSELKGAQSALNHTAYVQIPNSFASEEACISQTNACSLRGSCLKSSSGRWACQCASTKEGDYTYYWGGSDCSKRDVSFQFNLLVGTTLAIVVAATLSVVLLFNLGKENGVPDTVKL